MCNGCVRNGKKVGEVVCSYVADNRIDAVVMGAQGLGGRKSIGNKLSGTVSEYLTEHCTCDVILVKKAHFADLPRSRGQTQQGMTAAEQDQDRQRMKHQMDDPNTSNKVATNMSDSLHLDSEEQKIYEHHK